MVDRGGNKNIVNRAGGKLFSLLTSGVLFMEWALKLPRNQSDRMNGIRCFKNGLVSREVE